MGITFRKDERKKNIEDNVGAIYFFDSLRFNIGVKNTSDAIVFVMKKQNNE